MHQNLSLNTCLNAVYSMNVIRKTLTLQFSLLTADLVLASAASLASCKVAFFA